MTQIYSSRTLVFLSLWTVVLCAPARAAELKQKTTTAFDRYVTATEARFANELRPGGPFLYVDGLKPDEKRKAYEQLKQGEILVEKLETRAPGVSADIPDGMVHHWVGLIFIPGATLSNTLPLVKDYDRRAELYKPDVSASRTLFHQGDEYKMFLRLHQKKFTTVDFNTTYDVHWGQVDATRVFSNSISTRIAEVKDPARPEGEELPVGSGHGYLWRLNTYWRFEEKDGGVYLQCEALSLTRDMPTGLGWLLRPLVTAIPKASLNRALGQTRRVVMEESKKCCSTAQSR
jgi:hypothetical protein